MKGTIQATAQKRTGVKPEGGRVPRWLQQAVLAWMFFAAFGVQRTQTISAVGSTGIPAISHTCDDNSKRLTRTKAGTTDTFGWDDEPRREGSAAVDSPEANPEGDRAAGSSRSQNRLVSLIKQSAGGTGTYSWMYDYRTRRVSFTKDATTTDITFSGGVSVGETENGTPSVGYVRGSDWGGGVGGILYTLRSGAIRYNHYNTRGDVVVQMDASQNTTYAAQYKAFGDRSETGSSPDRQRSNTKDEDMPGYANEGHRFRDIETSTFISADPAGFIDGPNLYAYVRQNPWTAFDPHGLYLDLAIEAVSVSVGVGSAISNFRSGNIGSGFADLGFAALDVGLAVVPGVPGGTGLLRQGAKQAAKHGDTVVDAAKGGGKAGDVVAGGNKAADAVPSKVPEKVPAGGGDKPGGPTAKDISDGGGSSGAGSSGGGSGGGSGGSSGGGSGAADNSGDMTSRAARREAMRQEGIPTSQQPSSQSRNASGREYQYEVPKPGGGTQTKSVQQQTMDRSHPGQGHWEAGTVKTDPVTGATRMNNHGRPKLQNDKSKVDYND